MGSLEVAEAICESLLKQGSFERGKVLFVSTHPSSQLNANSPRRDYNRNRTAGAAPHTSPGSGRNRYRELGQRHKTVTCQPLLLPKKVCVLIFRKNTQTFNGSKPNCSFITTKLPDCHRQPGSRQGRESLLSLKLQEERAAAHPHFPAPRLCRSQDTRNPALGGNLPSQLKKPTVCPPVSEVPRF